MKKTSHPSISNYFLKQPKNSKAGFLATASTALALLFTQHPTNAQQNYTNTTDSLSQKKLIELVDSSDNIEHQKIITTSVYDIFEQYGEKQGMEIIRKHMVIEINKIRSKLGLFPYVLDDTLSKIAQNYAQYMKENNHFSHYDLAGNSPKKRVENYLGKNNVFSLIGENNICGYTIIDQAIKDWMSGPHAFNITKHSFTHVGIGYYQGYWVQLFGKKIH